MQFSMFGGLWAQRRYFLLCIILEQKPIIFVQPSKQSLAVWRGYNVCVSDIGRSGRDRNNIYLQRLPRRLQQGH